MRRETTKSPALAKAKAPLKTETDARQKAIRQTAADRELCDAIRRWADYNPTNLKHLRMTKSLREAIKAWIIATL